MTKRLFLETDRPEFIVNEVNSRHDRSPDMKEIREERPEQLVFVYGTLKKGFGNHRLVADSKYMGRGFTRLEGFKMFDTGRYPVVMHAKGYNRVYGEVYAVTPDVLIQLDYLENNGMLYQREKQIITLLDQRIEGLSVLRYCWIYIGMDDAWGDCGRMRQIQLNERLEPKGLVYQ